MGVNCASAWSRRKGVDDPRKAVSSPAWTWRWYYRLGPGGKIIAQILTPDSSPWVITERLLVVQLLSYLNTFGSSEIGTANWNGWSTFKWFIIWMWIVESVWKSCTLMCWLWCWGVITRWSGLLQLALCRDQQRLNSAYCGQLRGAFNRSLQSACLIVRWLGYQVPGRGTGEDNRIGKM